MYVNRIVPIPWISKRLKLEPKYLALKRRLDQGNFKQKSQTNE